MRDLITSPGSEAVDDFVNGGGLFLESTGSFPSSFVSLQYNNNNNITSSSISQVSCSFRLRRTRRRRPGVGFLSVSLSAKDGSSNSEEGFIVENENENEIEIIEKVLVEKQRERGAFNTTKHLWAGAVAAMVSRSHLLSIVYILFYYYHQFPYLSLHVNRTLE